MKSGLGILLLSAAAVTLLSGCQEPSQDTASRDGPGFEAVAQAAARGEDRVSPDELARWIIEDRKDFVLVDVRDDDAYRAGAIDGSQHLPMTKLVAGATLETLPADRKIVIYSTGSENAAKAAVMLRLTGRDARLLTGGYNFWAQRVLNPDIPESAADDELPEVAERRAIYCYFAGETAPREAPPVPSEPVGYVPPVAPATSGHGGGALVTEEGC